MAEKEEENERAGKDSVKECGTVVTKDEDANMELEK